MTDAESFPRPQHEFEHLPPRAIDSVEAHRAKRTIEVTTHTYQDGLLDDLHLGSLELSKWHDMRAGNLDVESTFSRRICRRVDEAREKFFDAASKLDNPGLFHSLDTSMFPSDLGHGIEFSEMKGEGSLFEYEQENGRQYAIGLEREPTPGEFVLMLHVLRSDASRTANVLKDSVPDIISKAKRSLVESSYLSSKEFDHRIKNVEIAVVDPFVAACDAEKGQQRGWRGKYSDDTIVIRSEKMTSLSKQELLLKSIFKEKIPEAPGATAVKGTALHELLHQLSGKKRTQYTHNGTSEWQTRRLMEGYDHDPHTEIWYQRIGMRTGGLGTSRFNWLNEAVTRELEARIKEGSHLDNKHFGRRGREIDLRDGYAAEQIVARSILEGVDFDLVAKAYFEDSEPHSSEPSPHWGAFLRAVNDVHYPGYLAEVDDTIHTVGIKAVAEELYLFDSVPDTAA